jgi:hypothetical protein
MPRIRTLKPEIWQDGRFGKLGLLDQLVFIGLITQADDYGRLPDNARLLEGQLFPYHAERTCAESLAVLEGTGLILRYTPMSGDRLIQIAGWQSHQVINKRGIERLAAPSDLDWERHRERKTVPVMVAQPEEPTVVSTVDNAGNLHDNSDTDSDSKAVTPSGNDLGRGIRDRGRRIGEQDKAALPVKNKNNNDLSTGERDRSRAKRKNDTNEAEDSAFFEGGRALKNYSRDIADLFAIEPEPAGVEDDASGRFDADDDA